MSANPQGQHSIQLSLSREDHWTLHHVLLDRIEREATAEEPSKIDAPPISLFHAFETLDAGETSFTIAQLEAVQTILAEYHHSSTRWELERSALERLLHQVTVPIEQHRSALPAD